MVINKLLVLLVLSIVVYAQESFVGVVKPIHNIKLSLSTDGIVKKVLVHEGSFVKKGDTLIVLDNELQKLETQRRKLINEDRSKVDSSINESEILSSLYESTKKLYENSGGISKSELQSLEIKYLESVAQSQYLQKAEVQENIEYKIAKKLLDQFTLYSPIDGIVTKINIDLGEFVKNTEPILSIVDSAICVVELNIDKDSIDLVKKDQEVTISSGVEPNIIYKKAKIVFISPIADMSSGLFFVKVQFSNSNLEILPGLTVNVSLSK